MTTSDPIYPQKKRELHNMLMDSTRWDGFEFRDDDIVIDTWAKSGTTWTQQIVSQLIFNGTKDLPAMDMAPWLDLRVIPYEETMAVLEAQTHRRFIKSHLPADALDISPKAKYLFLARDGRDVVWSWYKHLTNMTPEFFEMINSTPDRVGPPLEPPTCDVHEFFHNWLEQDGLHNWSYWAHIQSWWDVRDTPNVALFHFNNLKADMPGEIRRMAEFLEIEIDEDKWPDILRHCSFAYMKENADALSSIFDKLFKGGLTNFIYKGTNGRWRDILSPEDIEAYERVVSEKMTPDCARWHATGELAG